MADMVGETSLPMIHTTFVETGAESSLGIYLICIQIQGLAKQQKIMLFLNKHIYTNVNSCTTAVM